MAFQLSKRICHPMTSQIPNVRLFPSDSFGTLHKTTCHYSFSFPVPFLRRHLTPSAPRIPPWPGFARLTLFAACFGVSVLQFSLTSVQLHESSSRGGINPTLLITNFILLLFRLGFVWIDHVTPIISNLFKSEFSCQVFNFTRVFSKFVQLTLPGLHS